VIGGFISNLSDNGKKLLAIAFVIVVIALFDRLLIGPTMSRMEAIDQDIAKEESTIKQDLHFLGYKNKILKESQALSPYITDKLPAEEEIIAAFLKKIEMLANKSNVTLIKVTPSTGSQQQDYLKYEADLECSGKFVDIVSFMHLIDTSNELMKVVKFNFSSKKADSDDLKAVMTIDKIVVGKHTTGQPVAAKTPATTGESKSTAPEATAATSK
jgi:hypothetical protein